MYLTELETVEILPAKKKIHNKTQWNYMRMKGLNYHNMNETKEK